MVQFFKKYSLYFIGAVVGAIAGYLYYRIIGCDSGTCAISSNPVNSTLYFAGMGALVFGMFSKEKNEKSSVNDNTDING